MHFPVYIFLNPLPDIKIILTLTSQFKTKLITNLPVSLSSNNFFSYFWNNHGHFSNHNTWPWLLLLTILVPSPHILNQQILTPY